jgi:hypothetical protein
VDPRCAGVDLRADAVPECLRETVYDQRFVIIEHRLTVDENRP